jgi:hypothetical protein
MINDEVRSFECMDIDNPYFINTICSNTGLTKEEYYRIMELDEEDDCEEEDYNSDKED